MCSSSPDAEGNTVQVLRRSARTIKANSAEVEMISPIRVKLHDTMDFTGGDDGFSAVIAKIKKPTY